MKKFFGGLLFLFIGNLTAFAESGQQTLWEIGKADRSPQGMALAPSGFKDFVAHDFGFEDRYFLVGHSQADEEWPYVLPGPANGWGGTGRTAGIRSSVLHIDFQLAAIPEKGNWEFRVEVLQTDPQQAPTVKILVNGKPWLFQLKAGNGPKDPDGSFEGAKSQFMSITIPDTLMKVGANEISLTTLAGGWLVFDHLILTGPPQATLKIPGDAFIREVKAAPYAIRKEGKVNQALWVDVLRLSGNPLLEVKLDGQTVLKKHLDSGRQVLEVPMPVVENERESRFALFVDGQPDISGEIVRRKVKEATPADYVNTMIGAAHSRWMIAPGPWMPFGMLKISPDNQNAGWQAGYDPTFESIGTFSHIHEWTMAGLGTFPVNGTLQTHIGDQDGKQGGYRSRIDKTTEEAPLGYYKADLIDYDITAELTAATRSSFQRYTYHRGDTGRVMIDLKIPAEYNYQLKKIQIKKVNDHRIEGYSEQLSRNVWSGGVDQAYTIYFVMEFDQPISHYGSWLNDQVRYNQELEADSAINAGLFVEFDVQQKRSIQVRTGISYVDIAHAAGNLKEEISDPYAWSFDAVRDGQRQVWNDLLGRLQVSSDDYLEKERFYTNMYRALASRNIFSDVDGSWRSADEQVRKFANKDDRALGCDAFWNTFWNLNQFWNLVTPEWSSRWVRSQLAMYDANGWLAKGPAGMEYIPVMVAEHEIPLLVSAYQMGIRDYDAEKVLEAAHKMQTAMPQSVAGGFAGNRDLATYLKHQYVPYDEGRFSNSMEYSFDDWTVSQLAKALGHEDIYNAFKDRGTWWRHAIDQQTGYARMRDARGNWLPNFDPFKSGANKHYVEGNAWQLTFFVPQDISGLADYIGQDTFLRRLDWGFKESYKWRFNGPNDQYWDYPVVQGNQQSMHFAYLFNWVKQPWLTQQWSRAIAERYYGHGIGNAYLGDEDQGQMSAWFVMNALGLFQMDGGTRTEPIYEIGSPLFERVEIDLGNRYGRGKRFVVEAKNTSRTNKYVQKAWLNGRPLDRFWFKAGELLKGGTLVLEMGPEPNKRWGIAALPPQP